MNYLQDRGTRPFDPLNANTTGADNTAVGYGVLNANTTGAGSVGVGRNALFAATTGGQNTVLGYQAGNSITTGTGNVLIGYDVDTPAATTNNHLNIGNTLYADLSTDHTGIGTATPAAKLHVSGEVIVGEQQLVCSATTKGAFRYNSADNNIDFCNGTQWQKIIAQGGSGAPPNPPAGNGYFVLTSGTWNGDLKTAGAASTGLLGADALSLSDLTANDWLGKGDATTNGQLNAAHIFAFLCNGGAGSCGNALPSTTYYFAVSGDNTKGGASFTTNTSGRGPGNNQNWTGTNYFDGVKTYWTARDATGGGTASTLWGLNGQSGSIACSTTWTSSSNANVGQAGTSNDTDGSRWGVGANDACDLTRHLICLVHPP